MRHPTALIIAGALSNSLYTVFADSVPGGDMKDVEKFATSFEQGFRRDRAAMAHVEDATAELEKWTANHLDKLPVPEKSDPAIALKKIFEEKNYHPVVQRAFVKAVAPLIFAQSGKNFAESSPDPLPS